MMMACIDLSFIILTLLITVTQPTSACAAYESFLECLSAYPNATSISTLVYSPENSSYATVLNASIQNLRFSGPTTPKPKLIVTPMVVEHIQATVVCARRNGLQIRVRSGGHDFEGLSYVARVPFVIIDMFNLDSVDVDVESQTAWVGAGAILGQLYYRIAEKTRTLAFPAGVCPSVGAGGHISGGGWGMLLRKYGLAADNVVDARIIDIGGRILDRNGMGEELFWAIRGGGGASFGVVVAWRVKLVPVPESVTAFSLIRTSEHNAAKFIHQWQYVAPKLPKEIMTFINITTANSPDGRRTAVAQFVGLYLGGVDPLIQLMSERFPELNLGKGDCQEMSWIQSILFVQNQSLPSGATTEILNDRSRVSLKFTFKGKSDYVREPISEVAIGGMLERLFETGVGQAQVVFESLGGIMDEIPASATPFPHRAGNIYQILYIASWREGGDAAAAEHIGWIRRLYDYMAPYVSSSPRRAYVNYRDLDVGINNFVGKTIYRLSKVWGEKYFEGNFDRLVRVKTEVDPGNFFRYEQSIPSLA